MAPPDREIPRGPGPSDLHPAITLEIFEPDLPATVETPTATREDWRAKVPSVSQLTRRLRGHIEDTFFDVWIRGEISNFRKPASGHAYFILKDATAQIRGCMFRPQLVKTKFALEDGMEVLVHGKVSVYEPRGEYQIIGDWVEPVGVGALQLAFEQLKAKLEREGLFAPEAKKTLPPLPSRIGVVTSPTGAAIRDILQVIGRRFNERHIYVLPAAVQGEKAAPEIVAAIARAIRWNAENPARAIECLIVGRGGGSLEDLWPFNEESVARAVFACPIPVISAVGHEIDFTICDFVADVRAPTPSAAAEIIFPRKADLILTVETASKRLHRAFGGHLRRLRDRLEHSRRRLIDPRARLKWMRSQFEAMQTRLVATMRHSLRHRRAQMQTSAERLHALSPLRVLGRGYSMTRTEGGAIVRTVGSLTPGMRIDTAFADGSVRSVVENVFLDDKNERSLLIEERSPT